MFLFTMNALDAVVLSITLIILSSSFGIGLGLAALWYVLVALWYMLAWLYKKFIEILDKFKKKDES